MPRIKRSSAPPHRLTRPTREAQLSESEDDEMRRFEVRPDDEWEVPDSPVDLYGVNDDDDDDDDAGGVERKGGMGLGSTSNQGVDVPAGDEEARDASDQGSSGPRGSPQRGVLPSVEEESQKTWSPLASYNVPRPARRGIPRRSHTASSLSAGRSFASPSPSPSPPPKRARIESEERDGNEEDADPYPAAPLLGNPGPGVGPWTNPPSFEHPPLSAADSAQSPAVNAASPTSPVAHAVIDPSLAGSPSALSLTGSPFAPSLAGSPFTPNLPRPASSFSPAVDTVQSALASSVPASSNPGPSSASAEPQPAITQDFVPPSAAGASSARKKRTRSTSASVNNSASANSASMEENPPLRRSGRLRKVVSAPVEEAVEPAKAKKLVRAVPQRRIEIKDNRLREDKGWEYNAFDLLYRKTDEDGPWTWETEDELWKTYRDEILAYWKGGRKKRLVQLVGGEKKMSPFYLARIYAHKIDNSPKLRHLADNDVRKQLYQWGWVGYKKLKWWTWDQLGIGHDDVRKYYLEKDAPVLVDDGPVAEDK